MSRQSKHKRRVVLRMLIQARKRWYLARIKETILEQCRRMSAAMAQAYAEARQRSSNEQ